MYTAVQNLAEALRELTTGIGELNRTLGRLVEAEVVPFAGRYDSDLEVEDEVVYDFTAQPRKVVPLQD